MTGIKHIAAGLMAFAMFTSSAVASTVAREPFAVMKSRTNVATAGHGPLRLSAPYLGETETGSQDHPGGVCDHGDNAMIC
jgi:hypothetical protein